MARPAHGDGKRGGGSSAAVSNATSPTKMGWRDLKAAVVRAFGEIGRDNLSIVAAGCAFYALLSIFPAITALVSIFGLIADPATIETQVGPALAMLPDTAREIVTSRLSDVAATGGGALSLSLIISVAIALWSANAAVKTIFAAMNIVYEEEETRGFFSLNLRTLAFTIGAIVGVVAALLVIGGLPVWLSLFAPGQIVALIAQVVGWLVLGFGLVMAIALIYRYGPDRRRARWRWLTPGAIAATVLWLIASALFSLYVANFASYGETYGALGAVIVLMMWLYISAYVVLLCGEINSELEHQTTADTTESPDRPMGSRGAYMADHVPE